MKAIELRISDDSMIIGNKYNIKTINGDEITGTIKENKARINGLEFIVIETSFYYGTRITYINLINIVSFYEMNENEGSVKDQLRIS